MVEPVTTFIAITTFLNMLYKGVMWIQEKISAEPPSPSTVLISKTTYQPVARLSSINEDPPSI
jgi:hypothetical protein